MSDLTKIATCCYCGTRAVLCLRSGTHELSCASCGAPLHMMKPVKVADPKRRRRFGLNFKHRSTAKAWEHDVPQGFGVSGLVQNGVAPSRKNSKKPKREKPYKHKQRRRPKRRIFEKFWNEVEDVFEDIFDFD